MRKPRGKDTYPRVKGSRTGEKHVFKDLALRNKRVSEGLKKYFENNPQSKERLAKLQLGRFPSAETRKKLSIARQGKKPTLGMKVSEETKKKMSEAHQKRISLGLWKNQHGGVKRYNGTLKKSSKSHQKWSKEVKDRDKWVCRIADVNCDGRLEAHHILPWSKFPELRYQINNGITLCQHHHPLKADEVAKLSPYFQSLVALTQ